MRRLCNQGVLCIYALYVQFFHLRTRAGVCILRTPDDHVAVFVWIELECTLLPAAAETVAVLLVPSSSLFYNNFMPSRLISALGHTSA